MHRMSFVFSEHVCNQDEQRLVNSIRKYMHSMKAIELRVTLGAA